MPINSFFDQLDRKIIALLQKDGRASGAEIAQKLGVSGRTVRNRIDRLIEHHAIMPTVIVNHSTFGFTTVIDVFCQVDIHRIEQIAMALAEFPEINYVAFSTGDRDLSIQAVLESNEALYTFMQRIAAIPGVRRTQTVLVPRLIKNIHEWIPPASCFQDFDLSD